MAPIKEGAHEIGISIHSDKVRVPHSKKTIYVWGDCQEGGRAPFPCRQNRLHARVRDQRGTLVGAAHDGHGNASRQNEQQ